MKVTQHKSVYGFPLFGIDGDKTFSFCIQGNYGFFFSHFLSSQFDIDFIDIGASYGLYSLIAGLNPNIHSVYSFEPNPKVYDLLKRNSKNLCLEGKIYPFNLGIFSGPGVMDLAWDERHSGKGQIEKRELDNQEKKVTVEVISRVGISKIFGAPVCRRVGVKIDVEGVELEVIRELLNSSLSNCVDWLYVEIVPCRVDEQAIIKYLRGFGFSLVHIEGPNNHYDGLFLRGGYQELSFE